MTNICKTVLPEVHEEGVEGDDCGAGHLRQEGGEPGRAGHKGPTQAPAGQFIVLVSNASIECRCSVLVFSANDQCQC